MRALPWLLAAVLSALLLRQAARVRELVRARASAAAACAAPTPGPWTVPVLVLRYFPVLPDGRTVDIGETSNVGGPLDDLKAKCDRMNRETVEALEQGSRYHAYKDPSARPSLHYDVLATVDLLEPLPRDAGKRGWPDYRAILERVGIRRWVMERGVKEVWIWGYHSPSLAPWESNMAGPFGDLSNSDRDPGDLPVLEKTYVVYHYNYQRQTSEAVHDHLHQIEAQMRAAGGELWAAFEGRPGAWRAGNCHFPPNGLADYDWNNSTTVLSDIEDWRPEGRGEMKPLSAAAWGGESLRWFVYWMQSIPGAGNGLSYRGRPLGNWWAQVGDYDCLRSRGVGLTAP